MKLFDPIYSQIVLDPIYAPAENNQASVANRGPNDGSREGREVDEHALAIDRAMARYIADTICSARKDFYAQTRRGRRPKAIVFSQFRNDLQVR